ncbi:MAG: hypothetical protein AB3N15_10490 [Paracoccaceae bacterium]
MVEIQEGDGQTSEDPGHNQENSGNDSIGGNSYFGNNFELARSTHYNPVEVFHEVSDDQLEALVGMGNNVSLSVALACIGIAFGLAQNLFRLTSSLAKNQVSDSWDALASAICILMIGIGLTSFFVWVRDRGKLKLELDKLRKRPAKEQELSLK